MNAIYLQYILYIVISNRLFNSLAGAQPRQQHALYIQAVNIFNEI